MPEPHLARRREAALTGLADAGAGPSLSTNIMGQKDTPRTVLMFSEVSVILWWDDHLGSNSIFLFASSTTKACVLSWISRPLAGR